MSKKKEIAERIEQEQKQAQAYSHALDLLKYEGEMLWQILGTYMVVNTLLIGFIGQAIITNPNFSTNGSWPCVFGGFFGLAMVIPWYGTFLRNSKYYRFRMDQARKLEDLQFPLLNGDGHLFAENNKVPGIEKPHHLHHISAWMRNKRAADILILSFVIIYFLAIVYCWPNLFKIINR